MRSIMFRILNIKEFQLLEKEIELLEDAAERDARFQLLDNIQSAITDYDVHVREYAWKQSYAKLLNRGLSIAPTDRDQITALWDSCFDRLVTQIAKQSEPHYTDQFRWHLFSFELLPALQGDEARAAFDSMNKNELYLFFDYADECRLIKNAQLLTAADIEAVKKNSPLNYMDMYFFDPVEKWTYVKPHEEYCGPYFFEAD